MRSEHYLTLLVALLTIAGALCAGTIYVDDDASNGRESSGTADQPYATIQDAIDAAKDEDTISVAPGHYLSPDTWQYDQINFKGKNIRLVSSAPSDFSVVEKTVLCGVVIFLGNEGPQCLLQGFKIQNHSCGGILGNQTQATISHCIISGNGPCGATVIKDCRGRISNCLIVDNTTFFGCDVQPVISGCIDLVNCTIANNLSPLSLDLNANTHMRNCIVYGNNASEAIASRGSVGSSFSELTYSLIERGSLITNGGATVLPSTTGSQLYGRIEGDPCFVGLGSWMPGPGYVGPEGPNPIQAGISTLVEGDYHLMSEGWRWNSQESHGSHWYFDSVTSPCIDAGDPMDGLGEEPERVQQDLEGRYGVNHAIDMGAYGATAQASLAPTRGKPPGVGAVDLNDYWPLAKYASISSYTGSRAGNSWTTAADNNQPSLRLYVNAVYSVKGFEVYAIQYSTQDASGRVSVPPIATAYYVYVDNVLYKTLNQPSLDLLPQITGLDAQYTQYLTPGSTILLPDDPSLIRPTADRSTVVVRGTLADVLAGTRVNPTRLLSGAWVDVIAFKELMPSGAPGEPIIILARGFGPLMWNGQPVSSATVSGRTFPGGTSGTTVRGS